MTLNLVVPFPKITYLTVAKPPYPDQSTTFLAQIISIISASGPQAVLGIKSQLKNLTTNIDSTYICRDLL